MTEVVYYAAISLDGFIAKPDGNVDWLNKYLATGEDYGFEEFNASIQATLMGRVTYEKSLELDGMLGEMPCWVFSSTLKSAEHPKVKITTETPAQVVNEMSTAGITRAWMMGGGKLAASFMAAGMIHQYDLAIMPEILGDGIPLLQPSAATADLMLANSTMHPSGVVQVNYRLRNPAVNK